jgi:hypothetical protein
MIALTLGETMSQKIFGDADLTVHVMRNPVSKNEQTGQQFQYDGIVYQLTCQHCETPIKIGMTWQEVRMCLEGMQLPAGVTRIIDGWQIEAKCPDYSCSKPVKFKILDEELEREASMEVTRRQRLQNARASQHPQQRLVRR